MRQVEFETKIQFYIVRIYTAMLEYRYDYYRNSSKACLHSHDDKKSTVWHAISYYDTQYRETRSNIIM